jgi:hypothetical protein
MQSRPTKVSTSTTSIKISWNEPLDNGGCSIEGYSVFIDDGNNGNFAEANFINDNNVRLHPSLSSVEISRIDPLSLGSTYRIYVNAHNYAGHSQSPILGVVFAALPS